MKKNIWLFLILLCAIVCDSLEDTYSDYAGDGPRRYLGKCSDIKVVPGWKRLQVSWVNGVDPVVKNIRITWTRDGVVCDSLLPKDATSCNILNLQNGDYEIKVAAVDERGNASFDAITFARPYSEDHEAALAFTRLVSKHFFVRDRLVLFFDQWDENVHEARLNYTAADGTFKSFNLEAIMKKEKYYLFPEAVDPTGDIFIERKGYIEGCVDLITFAPIELKHERSFVTDFKLWMRNKYGQIDINDSFVENQEELEVDYSISSLEDILYFPNLKKLYLGKNRFLKEMYLKYFAGASDIFELEKTLFALNVAHEVLGLKIERYNEHFLPVPLPSDMKSYTEERGNPVLPTRLFFDMDSWTFEVTPHDEENYDSHLNWLFDENLTTAWQPDYHNTARLHEIKVDMKEKKSLNGVRISQKDFDPEADQNLLNWLPGVIMIQVSSDGIFWYDASETKDYPLGNTAAEITDIVFHNPVEARYLKFIVSDQLYGKNFSVTLADIEIF